MTDLLAGQIQIMFDPLQFVLANVRGGDPRAFAAFGEFQQGEIAKRGKAVRAAGASIESCRP